MEILSERTESSKTFATDVPGVYQTDYYNAPVHYADATGELVDIDPRLVQTADGQLEAAETPVPTQVAADGSGKELASVELFDGAAVSFGLEGSAPNSVEVIDSRSVIHRDALPGVDIELEPLPLGIKETLYLDSADAPTEYLFPLTLTPDLSAEVDESGNVVFSRLLTDPVPSSPLESNPRKATRKVPVGLIPRGWMEDANLHPQTREGNISYGVTYEILATAEGPVLKVRLDEAWLRDDARRFPVRVDPTLTQYNVDLDDTYATPTVGADQSNLMMLKVGYGGLFQNRAFLRFTNLTSGPTSLVGKTIHGADLRLYQHVNGSCTATPMDIYRVTSAWTGSTVTWTNQPTVGEKIATASSNYGATGCAGGDIPANWFIVGAGMKQTVENWANGTWANNGFSLRAPNELSAAEFKHLESGNNILPPHMTVLWSNPGASSPAVPTQVKPSGKISTDTPQLSAVYSDPQGDSGAVTFVAYDAATGALVGYATGTTVPSGGTSTFNVPAGTFQQGKTYRIEAFAVDAGGNGSLNTVGSSLTPKAPRTAAYSQDFPDPEVVRDGATYFAFSTNSEVGATQRNVPRITSTDLKTWSTPTDALPIKGAWASSTGFDFSTWAPAVHKFGSTWVLYYTANHAASGKACLGTATASSVTGTFSPASSTLVCVGDPGGQQGAIDASTFVHPTTGDVYLLWKNDGNADGPGGAPVTLWARKLDTSGTGFAVGSTAQELLTLGQPSAAAWEGEVIEQPEMIYKDSTYYLLYSGNDFADDNYAMGYATCPSGPAGLCTRATQSAPWFASTNSVHYPSSTLKTATAGGPGAANFFTDLNFDGTWMGYHGYTVTSGLFRYLYLDKAEFDSSGPTLDFAYPVLAAGFGDLGDLGYDRSEGWAINDSGEVAGSAPWGVGRPDHAVVWTEDDGWTDFGNFSSNGTQAEAINDSAQFVGSDFTDEADVTTHRPTRWHRQSNSFQYLPTLGATYGWAWDINDDGYAVGGADETPGAFFATRWSPFGGSPTKLFGTNYAEARGINDAGEIVGYYFSALTPKAFYWTSSSGMVDMGTLGGSQAIATKINNSGTVVGCSYTSSGAQHAFNWTQGGGMVDIGTLFPGNSCALGVNDRGQIVGYFYDSLGRERGFLWTQTAVYDIGSLGGGETAVADINNQGIITGFSVNSAGKVHAFVRGTGDVL